MHCIRLSFYIRPNRYLADRASGLLDAEGLVAAAALFTDEGKLGLQRVAILDLALGIADRLGEACNVLLEARLVLPDLGRRAVIAFERLALDALGEQRRQLLGGIIELHERCVHCCLIVGLFALDHRSQGASVLPIALHHGLGVFELVLLGHRATETEQQRARNQNTPLHQSLPYLHNPLSSHWRKPTAVLIPTPPGGGLFPNWGGYQRLWRR